MDGEIYKQIIQKKELSKLPKKDVERAFEHFKKRQCSDIEKIRLTRDLLRRSFTAFMGRKIMNPKNKDIKWFLTKHISTKERFSYYNEVYSRILDKEKTIIDLGAGINGLSYEYFNKQVDYIGIEGVGQLVDLMNYYFKKNKINGRAIHLSLFELEKIKKIIKDSKKPKIVFLFKTVDSLEMLKRNYSKELLDEITPLCNKIVVSFAMRSFFKKHLFKVRREWAINYIKKNFKILDDFELGTERYMIFKK